MSAKICKSRIKSRVIGADKFGTSESGLHKIKERESKIEHRLAEAVKKKNGMCPKFVSPGFDGMPDRIVLLPNVKVGFVEVKRKGEKPRALQVHRMEQLRRLGFQVFVLDDTQDIPQIIKAIGGDD